MKEQAFREGNIKSSTGRDLSFHIQPFDVTSLRPNPHRSKQSYVILLVTQLCLTLCDPMDGGPPGSSVHGILQARILEWVATLFSRGIFFPAQKLNPVSRTAGRFFTIWAPREALSYVWEPPKKKKMGWNSDTVALYMTWGKTAESCIWLWFGVIVRIYEDHKNNSHFTGEETKAQREVRWGS